ncbi:MULTISPECIES: pyrroline-5-carboxylate reductase [Aneurinibacillus]|uniref:Pyrroline-5-carboxylate reductase n=1 Tax=Aneurinibacillus thermoaerophilus TaxID=143495 RepID=A0A1G8CL94_ANETH|nr:MULTISPECIES: pyrroline-5-carboxylate reductase [Aneurinibacillus]AMA71918.1 pyrroline-5-carboxylate reductase [Aneurinibacillus sp. XH2]MED0675531.1 pyrroline-5-carboxylate reductase [Aneurinibacillus thermoaerophilus]MED0680298.1 pyrroline-5-carboxylate reductase [Aneurinibacillus thermoaerophilus]MED0737075.1 pyrroline-5-carboxylate reductase [Aneurinibacillus thermoaerophilus]MED0757355.1 pyrroline-5-carboxylate reductase [Aneurinibacillus thermoaerophilus]
MSSLKDKTICFLGAGSMAEAMISGLVNKNLLPSKQICALNRSNSTRIRELATRYGISILRKEEAIRTADIIILAVKPKDIDAAIAEIQSFTRPKQLFISVLAGISTDYISHLLGHQAPVIRTMPNTSAAVGLSATAIASGAFATEKDMELAMQIFQAIGIVETVKEKDLHAVTGLSGSGPAYVYYLVEAMEAAGREIGLAPEVARRLILQTIIGAAHMLRDRQEEPALLRKQVTSPNGTTAAGIAVLEERGFQEAMLACIKRAAERSAEMGKQSVSAS